MQALKHDFVNIDDPFYVKENIFVRRGLDAESITWAFTTTNASNYHPLTWVSLMVDAELWDNRPSGFILTNILLHSCNVVLLFAVMRRMSGSLWASAFVAAFFAFHPSHVESVAWISERKDVLSIFLGLASMYAYVIYAEKPSTGRYAIMLGLFILSLFAKQMLVTLPFLLLLLDYWPMRRFRGQEPVLADATPDPGGANVEGATPAVKFPQTSPQRIIAEKVPMILLSILFSVIIFLVQRYGGSVVSLSQIGLMTRINNAIYSYFCYLAMTFWPMNLAVYYPHLTGELPFWKVFASAAVLVTITVVSFLDLPKRPFLMIGWLWFLGTLVPVIGILQVGEQGLADRYTYFPQIGIAIMLAWGIPSLFPAGSREKSKVLVGGIAAVSLAVLFVICFRQIGYWQNTGTLFERTLALTEKNHLAHNNLGIYYKDTGKPEKSLEQFNLALAIEPNLPKVHNNIGLLLIEQGKFDEAITKLQGALEIVKKNVGDSRDSVSRIYTNLGVAHYRKKQINEAIEAYEKAIELDPYSPLPRINMGQALEDQGKIPEATASFEAALKLDAVNPALLVKLSTLAHAKGNREDAIAYLERANELVPGEAGVHSMLGQVLIEQGDLERGLKELYEAIKLSPTDKGLAEQVAVQVHNVSVKLAGTYVDSNPGAAMFYAENALKFRQNDPKALSVIGLVKTRSGKVTDGLATLKQAEDIAPQDVDVLYRQARARFEQQKFDEGVNYLRKVLENKPDQSLANMVTNDLSWTLSTHYDDSLRNGKEALDLIEKLNEQTKGMDPFFLDTLAAAYAETDQFDKAVEAAEKAIKIFNDRQQVQVAAVVEKRLSLYKDHKKFRDDPPKSPPPKDAEPPAAPAKVEGAATEASPITDPAAPVSPVSKDAEKPAPAKPENPAKEEPQPSSAEKTSGEKPSR
ncbi:MAG: tetratricopeptide repeat protein [Planctomycetota bacterium]